MLTGKDAVVRNVLILLARSAMEPAVPRTKQPLSSVKTERDLILAIEARVLAACKKLVGQKMTSMVLAQMRLAADDAADWVCARTDATFYRPIIRIEQCTRIPNEIHIIVLPGNWTGRRSYTCGCEYICRSGMQIFDNGSSVSDKLVGVDYDWDDDRDDYTAFDDYDE
jgi:hypothetical protein